MSCDLFRSDRSRFRLAVAVLVSLLGAVPTVGQELPMGPLPQSVTLEMVDGAYTVSGSTADELLSERRSRRFYAYRWRIEWTYRQRQMARPSLSNPGSNTCETDRLTMRLIFTTRYPRWDQPADASPELVAAWSGFMKEVTAHWVAHRDVAVGATREIISRAGRLQEPCPLIFRRAERMVDEVLEQYNQANLEVDQNRPGWPPAGYSEPRRPPPPASKMPAPRAKSSPAGEPDREASPSGAVLDMGTAARADMKMGSSGIVLGLIHRGAADFLGAFGVPPGPSDAPLRADAPFAFPALSELLVGILVDELQESGAIDPDAPIGSLLPAIGGVLGTVTLSDLLSHRGGLDDRPAAGADRAATLDGLSDERLFTEPGSVQSRSRYSFPLAVRVIERSTGADVVELMREHVWDPLSLDSTTFVRDEAAALGLVPSYSAFTGAWDDADAPVAAVGAYWSR